MTDLDTLFPNRLECFYALFQDSVYVHDGNFNYQFNEGQFERRDRVFVIKNIMKIADWLFSLMQEKNPDLTRCEPFVNHVALLQAINRYT